MEENENNSAVTRAGLPLKKDVLIRAGFPLKGGPGSGNFDHPGNSPNVGGSGEGGGSEKPETYHDYKDADKAFTKWAAEQDKTDTTKDYEGVVNSYTGKSYAAINDSLRGDKEALYDELGRRFNLEPVGGWREGQREETLDKFAKQTENDAKMLREAVNNGPQYEGTVYRGTWTSDGDLAEKLSTGNGEITINGMVSTSSDSKILDTYTNKDVAAYRPDQIYEVRYTIENARGAAVQGLTDYQVKKMGLDEVLLDSGHTYEIKSANTTRNSDGSIQRIDTRVRMK